MALIKCPECGGSISDKAAACPYCGWLVYPKISGHVLQTECDKTARPARGKKENFLVKLWVGYYPLGRTFWWFNILLPFVVSLYAGIAMLFAAFLFDFEPRVGGISIKIANIYTIIASVGLWRSASRHQGKQIWAIFAKIFSALCLLSVAIYFISEAVRGNVMLLQYLGEIDKL